MSRSNLHLNACLATGALSLALLAPPRLKAAKSPAEGEQDPLTPILPFAPLGAASQNTNVTGPE